MRGVTSFVALAFGFGVVGVPLAVEAQAPMQIPRIGYLAPDLAPDPGVSPFAKAFLQGLRELGYIEGKNILIEWRFAGEKLDRLPVLAAELVRLKVDLIVADSTVAAIAAKRATTTIPIVFPAAVDAVAAGLVATVARPGENIMGISMMLMEVVGKQVELLKEVAPSVTRLAVLWHAANPAHERAFREVKVAARSLGLLVQNLSVRRGEDFARALESVRRERAEAIFILADAFIEFHRRQIVDFAVKNRLPSIFSYRMFVHEGGLMSYGADLVDMFRQSARLVDKILKGARPGDPPVEQPTKFELVINLKTAKALGLTIPQSVLMRADEVIK